MNIKSNTLSRVILRKKQGGVAAIEFSLGFMAFFLMCMTWAEIGYMAHISSVTDVAISEAARQAKLVSPTYDSNGRLSSNSSNEFMATFKNVITQESAQYGGLVDSNNYRFTIQYLKSIQELGDYVGDCRGESDSSAELECGSSEASAIAVYAVEYDFEPMLSQFIAVPGMFRREVIVVQEYERDAFDF